MEAILKYFILPSNLIVLLAISGIVLFLTRVFKKTGSFLLSASFIIYILFAIGPISFWLLGNLEYQYPPLNNLDTTGEVEMIVVLTGYAENDRNIPLSSRVNSSSAFRLIETVRLHQAFPKAEIIITGYGDTPGMFKELLLSLGLSDPKIILETKAGSTLENAKNVKSIVGVRRFILVTSAGHMPRAMMFFNSLGMSPIPSPTDFLTRKWFPATAYLPSPINLKYSDLAIHEYVAMLYYRITKKI